ncbi:interleukin-8-like isoform X1 [Gadus macrocephalus]|uniref:interleukin-8-like isoform X1 n=2 Tax=Gadus macrocephalus TaxID=80720 RepID=UPI0028CB5E2C|nr:interleukin-8-like isoform X1 [Gadus macrocephalus]
MPQAPLRVGCESPDSFKRQNSLPQSQSYSVVKVIRAVQREEKQQRTCQTSEDQKTSVVKFDCFLKMKMTSDKIPISPLLVFLALLTITEGTSLRGLGVELRCRCIQTESRLIGRHIREVEIIPANSHCEESEIIATLKISGLEVCLDPEAPWVKKVIERMMSSRRRLNLQTELFNAGLFVDKHHQK